MTPELLAIQNRIRGASVPTREAVGQEVAVADYADQAKNTLNKVLDDLAKVHVAIALQKKNLGDSAQHLAVAKGNIESAKGPGSEAKNNASDVVIILEEAAQNVPGAGPLIANAHAFESSTDNVQNRVVAAADNYDDRIGKINVIVEGLGDLGARIFAIIGDVQDNRTEALGINQDADETQGAGNHLASQLESFTIMAQTD
jgi:hypothetical protein